MKNNKYKPFFRSLTVVAILMGASAVDSFAQGTIKGRVLDQSGSPVAGANITVKGTTISSVSDANGDFQLGNVPSGSQTVNVSYLGLQSREEAFQVIDGATISQNFSLEGVEKAGKKINLSYYQKDSKDILGGVSYIDAKETSEYDFHTQIQDNFTGFMPGINGWSGRIRGSQRDPIYIIDGVIRDFNNISASEIDQVTVLKSAEAVMLYGSIGCNGAIVVTTKRGTVDGLKVKATVASGVDAIRKFPEYLGAAEYMTAHNAVHEADGVETRYTDEEIYNTAAGNNPYRYSDIDFFSSDYIKKAINVTDARVELDGGNEKTHFYSNVGYYHNGNFVNFGEAKDAGVNKLNVRGNVDINISKNIVAYINANATFRDEKAGRNDWWLASNYELPNFLRGSAPLIPVDNISPVMTESLDLVNNTLNLIDGKYFLGTYNGRADNAIADLYAKGDQKQTDRYFQFDAGVKANLSSLLEGLYFRANYSMDYQTGYKTYTDNKYTLFEPTYASVNGEDVIVSVQPYGEDVKTGKMNISDSKNNRVISTSGSLGYNNSFGNHNVGAVLVANIYQRTQAGQYHRATNANLGFMADYNFAHKYYASVGCAVPHTPRLAEGHRNGFSKSVSLGWNIANEEFLKGNSIISSLSIYANLATIQEAEDIKVSENGQDKTAYLYASQWEHSKYGNYQWQDNSSWSTQKITNTQGANEDLDFITRKSFSATLQAGFLHDMINVEASYFMDTRDGLIAKPLSSYPDFMNQGDAKFIAYQNLNDEKTTGFEFGVSAKKKFGDFTVGAGVFGMYSETKRTKFDEDNKFDYQNREGYAVDDIRGFQTLGIFQSQEEIDNYVNPTTGEKIVYNLGGGAPKPGDIIYIDQNDDNQIDDYDKVYLGRWSSPFVMGVNLLVKYKNFTFTAACSGNFGGYGNRNGIKYFQNDAENGKYSAIVRECWTPENAESAKYPRLTTTGSKNNYQESDFWLYKSDAFNIDRLQLTYDLPSSLFENNFIGSVSVFACAGNVLRISSAKDYTLLPSSTNTKYDDPEVKKGVFNSAPSTRRFMLGVRVSF